MELFLTLVNGETIEQSVDAPSCIVGRSSKCDVVIPHEGMSRQHCQIELIDGEVYLTDMGSTNGVLIDGQKITPHERTHYKTYLSLSFGAVREMQIDIEGGKIGADSSQTDKTTQHRAGFTRSMTRTMKNNEAFKNSNKAQEDKEANEKKDENKSQRWALNALALLLILAAAYWYFQNEVPSEEMTDTPVVTPQKNAPEESFERF